MVESMPRTDGINMLVELLRRYKVSNANGLLLAGTVDGRVLAGLEEICLDGDVSNRAVKAQLLAICLAVGDDPDKHLDRSEYVKPKDRKYLLGLSAKATKEKILGY
jgi:hypothetical protein